MGTLFKSEAMSRCQVYKRSGVLRKFITSAQVYLPPEAAYNCVAELGELGDAYPFDPF